jgi:hypothetical protein
MTTPASVSQIAGALQTAVETIPGLRTFDYLPDTFSPPVALVAIEEIEFHGAFAGGDVMHTFTVFVVVARTSDRAGYATLESYMSQDDSDPLSIPGAIEADPTLGGMASTTICRKASTPRSITINGSASYISVSFTVEVHA